MKVTRIGAENFRNLTSVSLSPAAGVNVFYGDNAQGKTNLIEALWLFTGARSFRGARDAELIRFGSKVARVTLDFEARGSEDSAAIAVSTVKQATLNGVGLDSVTALAGRFCAVVFSPDHLDLVKSGPLQRRRFIDSAITEIWPRYAASLLEYKELLRQRNALLKDIPFHSDLLDTLPVWDTRLSSVGASVVFTRLRYLARLSPRAASVYGGIAAKTGTGEAPESFCLSYEAAGGPVYPDEMSNARETLPAIRSVLEKVTEENRAGDIAAGITRAGPHRDDLSILIGGMDARLFASQGQQRSAVLALKLAEASVLSETIGEAPVLLLDDVMSELDRGRQDYILNNIGGCQVFITCCDPAGLAGLSKGGVFEVSRGAVKQIS